MTDKAFVYNSRTYYTLKASLVALPIFCLPLIGVVYLGRYLGSVVVAVVGGIIVLVTPFWFQERYKLLFSRKAVLEFDNSSFVVKELNLKDDRLMTEQCINWAEIKSYNFNISQSGTTYLNIFLRSGKRKGFSFSEEKSEKQVLNEESVLSIFYYFISQYNIGKAPEHTIIFRPVFLITNAGKRFLLSLFFASIALMILHIIISPATSMFSGMSFFILLGLVAKRKSNGMLYQKMSDLKPRSPYQ